MRLKWTWFSTPLLFVACGDAQEGQEPDRAPAGASGASGLEAAEGAGGAALPGNPRPDRNPVTSVEQALPGVFIPPFVDCRAPLQGEPRGRSEDGRVCTNVAISGATEPGRRFAEYASCEVVRTQRPYWPAPPAGEAASDDPRLSDTEYLQDLAWVKEQIAATGCSCCHDSRETAPSQWDIAAGPLWLDSLSDTGLALFAGFADSSVLGAYPPERNYGFARDITGIPTTDPVRMRSILVEELGRRGISEAEASAVPPFGGPIYTNSVRPPEPCADAQGVRSDGTVHWTGGVARYVYVLERGSANPGVPPNLDVPRGTLWRLDVLASSPALSSGVAYGGVPAGTLQAVPAEETAPALQVGIEYQLVALLDVGVPITNCFFTYGAEPAGPAGELPNDSDPSEGSPPPGDAPACAPITGGDERGFGATCADTVTHSDCPCEANYCSKSPFDSQGYCSITGCIDDPEICPQGWSCLDVSVFAPGQPSVCVRP